MRERGIACFGPDAAAAHLEGSKAFAKEVMAAAEVPTAMAHVCTTLDEVAVALDAFGAPHVVKDDGLAAGKGVVVTDDRAAALAHAEACLAREGGTWWSRSSSTARRSRCSASPTASRSSRSRRPRTSSGSATATSGPNTGGMGAYSPLPWAPDGLVDDVVERVARPVVAEMARRGTPFVGLLYCGLALTSRGLRVIEFNARFGDPETQVVLARLATPLGRAAARRRHRARSPRSAALRWRDEAAVTVVVAAHGYPGEVRSGDEITGLEAADDVAGVHVLHAGTAARRARAGWSASRRPRAVGRRHRRAT